MPELTRRQSTNSSISPSVIELHYQGPIEKKEAAEKALRSFGFTELNDSIPWRNLFPDVKDSDLPGISLRGSRMKEGMTQKQLAEKTGIPQRHISEMENGKRPIGKKHALLFGKALNIGYKVFL